MRKRLAACSVSALFLSGCGSAELYRTSTLAPDASNAPKESGYVFIAPYFAQVQNDIEVSIIPGTKKTAEETASPATFGVRLLPIPVTRVYLYLSKSALYSDAVNVGVGTDGMLASASSSSSQQFTAILTELGQTAGAALGAAGHAIGAKLVQPTPDDMKTCANAVVESTGSGSGVLYQTFFYNPAVSSYEVRHGSGYKLSLEFSLPQIPHQIETKFYANMTGFVAFYPYPVVAQLDCLLGDNAQIHLSPQIILNLYLDSHVFHPKRDFLSNPQDNFTLNEGFITGHQFSDQSPIKTVVDTITAPVRALLPATTVTTSVQTGGGKPEQTTTSTAVGPAKSQ